MRYLDIDLWSYRDMRIPRYRYQARKYAIPKYRDKEIKLPRYGEECPRSPQDGHQTGQDGLKMVPSTANIAPRPAKINPIWLKIAS